MSESEIRVSKGGTTFAGPDSVQVFRATVLRSAIGLLQKGIKPSRFLRTMKAALELTTPYTGRTYKNNESDQAIADLTVWIETMKSAIPVTHKEE